VWKTGATTDVALPVDLTGYTARMQVRAEIESATVLLELTTENGGIVLGGVTGAIDLFVDDVATAAISWEAGVYDIELISAAGDVRRLFSGSVTVSPEVTRAAL
jgi:hypothetical protein